MYIPHRPAWARVATSLPIAPSLHRACGSDTASLPLFCFFCLSDLYMIPLKQHMGGSKAGMWVLIGLIMEICCELHLIFEELFILLFPLKKSIFPPSVRILWEFLRFCFVFWCAVRPLLNVSTKTFLWHPIDRLDPVNKACDFKEAWWHFSSGVIEWCNDDAFWIWKLAWPWILSKIQNFF